MEEQLLKTKLYMPPLRSKIVSRSRLLERLKAGLNLKLTLVVAPPGYGKTTLLCEGLLGSRMPVAWLTLDEDDNDPTRFWLYVISALQTVRADTGISALKQLQSQRAPSIKFIITNVINEIGRMDEEFYLVLDDFHLIKTGSIHSDLAFLLDHIPPQIHLVIASRSDPALPLARLRGSGQLSEFGAGDLHFTIEEATAFLNQVMGLGLSDKDIAALESHTEGWIAGLQMAAVSMQGRKDIPAFIASFSGSSRHIMDYLTEEVLRKQEAGNLSFLLETAILDSLTASLCNAVTGRGDGQKMLEQLESANLFLVPLDDEHKWYRYHHLFADLLRNRLLQSQQTPVAGLYLRASKWFEREGLISEAIHYAFAAQDFDRAASLIEGTAKAAMFVGRVSTLLEWLEELPREFFSKWPRLGIYHAWATYLSGNFDLAEKMLFNTRKILQAMPYSSDNSALLGELATLIAMIAAQRCDLTTATREAGEALAYLPESEVISRARATMALGYANEFSGNTEDSIRLLEKAKEMALKGGNDFLAASVAGNLAVALIRLGRLTQAARLYQQIIDIGGKQETLQFPPAGIGYIGLAEISLQRNDLEAVARYIDKGMKLSQLLGVSYYQVTAHYVQARLKLAMGDRGGALNQLYQMEQIYPGEDLSILAFRMGEYQVRLRLLLKDLETALDWAESLPDIIRDKIKIPPPVRHEIQQILLAKVYLALGKHEEAIEVCDKVNASVGATGRVASLIETGLIKSLALKAQGKVSPALNLLERTLSLAEPEGYIRIFIDEGEPMRRLLQESASRGIQPEYVTRLLAAFKEAVSQLPFSPLLPEQLSKREIEVLRLIESGMSNRRIAEELVISGSTIKTHINNLYSKLGVQSRTQAIVRARNLNLL